MTEMTFEWDEKKNRINKRKHGISFEEAQTVLYDNDAIVFDDTIIRIISARKATKNETKIYREGMRR